MSTRLGGLAAVATGLLWFALLALIVKGDDIELLGTVVFLSGLVTLVLAVIGLGAAQGRAHPVATWLAVAVPVVGAVVALTGFLVLNLIYGDVPVLGDLTPWAIGTLGMATLVGAVLFGLVTLMSRVLSALAAALIAVGGAEVPALGAFVVWLGGRAGDPDADPARSGRRRLRRRLAGDGAAVIQDGAPSSLTWFDGNGLSRSKGPIYAAELQGP